MGTMTVKRLKSAGGPVRSKAPEASAPLTSRTSNGAGFTPLEIKIPNRGSKKFLTGFTLVEIMLATVILLIAILGTSAFRYNAALGARKADSRMAAARTALLLCESWRSVSDPNSFNPVLLASGDPNSALAVEAVQHYEGPAVPTDFTALGSYKIAVDGVNCYATLSWKDVSPGLRALNVIVAWDQRGSGTGYFADADKSFKLTTYVAN